MIPKIIHYCWFGNKKKNSLVKECIKTWKKHLPDYEIICWTEDNLPFKHPFVQAALKMRYFAFAADFTRLYVINLYGGIYLDTDVIIVKNFDELTKYDFFLGEEVPGRINLAIFGAAPNHPIVNHFLNFYNATEFDQTSLPVISFTLTKVLNKIKDDIMGKKDIIFDFNYFYPLPYEKRLYNYKEYINNKTFAVHLWNHSWRTAADYILDKEYNLAFNKIIEDVLFNKADRFNMKYYKNLYRHFRKSLK